ncbi:MAG: OB-fold domain-containing protein [Acidimicrobiia bacterium]|nr:OB-fold domain-containing protein [Acidimicrobiia bacterium]
MSRSRGAILGWGCYLPRWRLDRSTISAVAGTGGGKGTRTVASYDEDATTMAVAAGRAALDHASTIDLDAVWLATTSPPYLDKTNATAVHAALRLAPTVPAYDAAGAVRSGLGALRAACAGARPSLVVASDVRVGRPGGAEESAGGDGAAALVVAAGDGDVEPLAHVEGWASATEEFLDRWRTPGDVASKVWEERFGETRYVPLAVDAYQRALADAGMEGDDVDRVLVVGLHQRACAAAAKAMGRPNDDLVATLAAQVGVTGAACPAMTLAAALEGARPGEVLALVVLADGAEALVVRTTAAVADRPAPTPLVDQLAGAPVAYGTYLSWRGLLAVEPPRRPEPARPSAAAAGRSAEWKFGFVGSEGDDGTVHLPPSAFDSTERPMADAVGTIATFTVDRLAYSPSPPVIFALVDFDGGGRLPVELTDATPDDIAIGDRVEMTFRRLFTADGIHNYFWKARPVRESAGSSRSSDEERN